jgi:hypothetical protein
MLLNAEARQEQARLARELFLCCIQPALKPEDAVKCIVVNLDTGEYEMDADEVTVSVRARERFGPNALLHLLHPHHMAVFAAAPEYPCPVVCSGTVV